VSISRRDGDKNTKMTELNRPVLSIQDVIKIENELRDELKSIKQKKDRFREWTRSLGESKKVQEMFTKFDVRINELLLKLERFKTLREQVDHNGSHTIPLPSDAHLITAGLSTNFEDSVQDAEKKPSDLVEDSMPVETSVKASAEEAASQLPDTETKIPKAIKPEIIEKSSPKADIAGPDFPTAKTAASPKKIQASEISQSPSTSEKIIPPDQENEPELVSGRVVDFISLKSKPLALPDKIKMIAEPESDAPLAEETGKTEKLSEPAEEAPEPKVGLEEAREAEKVVEPSEKAVSEEVPEVKKVAKATKKTVVAKAPPEDTCEPEKIAKPTDKAVEAVPEEAPEVKKVAKPTKKAAVAKAAPEEARKAEKVFEPVEEASVAEAAPEAVQAVEKEAEPVGKAVAAEAAPEEALEAEKVVEPAEEAAVAEAVPEKAQAAEKEAKPAEEAAVAEAIPKAAQAVEKEAEPAKKAVAAEAAPEEALEAEKVVEPAEEVAVAKAVPKAAQAVEKEAEPAKEAVAAEAAPEEALEAEKVVEPAKEAAVAEAVPETAQAAEKEAKPAEAEVIPKAAQAVEKEAEPAEKTVAAEAAPEEAREAEKVVEPAKEAVESIGPESIALETPVESSEAAPEEPLSTEEQAPDSELPDDKKALISQIISESGVDSRIIGTREVVPIIDEDSSDKSVASPDNFETESETIEPKLAAQSLKTEKLTSETEVSHPAESVITTQDSEEIVEKKPSDEEESVPNIGPVSEKDAEEQKEVDSKAGKLPPKEDSSFEGGKKKESSPEKTSGKQFWKKLGVEAIQEKVPEEKIPATEDQEQLEQLDEFKADQSISPSDFGPSRPVPKDENELELAKKLRPVIPKQVFERRYATFLKENVPISGKGTEKTDPEGINRGPDSSQDEVSSGSVKKGQIKDTSAEEKHEKLFSVKRIRSRFSLRKLKKSKEDNQRMESGRRSTQSENQTIEFESENEPVSIDIQINKQKAEPVESTSVLYLGIDLGTSETTVAASNGVVETVLSVMGLPKDFISQKLLKKDKLFGIDALKNKLALKLYRPLEKGVIKDTDADLEAARELVKHVISLANPGQYNKVYAVIGAPARSSFANQQSLVDAAREVVDAVMIVSEPFAVAYGEGKIYNSLVIDIGAGTTDICCLKGAMPEEEDQFTLLKAGDFVDIQLMERIKSKVEGAQITKDLAKKLKEEYSYVIEPSKTALVEITVQGKPTKIDITKDIALSCESILSEIITCTKNIIANFNPEFQDELKQNIILAGGGSLIQNIDQYFERQLRSLGDVKVTRVADPIVAGAKGALTLAKDLTDDYWRAL